MIVKYEFVTAGERLFYHVQTSLLKGVDWDRLSAGLLPTGRSDELTTLFYEIAVANTTCRLVQAARSLRINAEGNNRITDDAAYIRDLKLFLREKMLIPSETISQTLGLSIEAAKAAASHISNRTRSVFVRNANNKSSQCYMCGCTLQFGSGKKEHQFELEHIWPNSFGGDSLEDNLLPVCHGCNKHKGSLATWGMAGVQSLIHGIDPSEEALKVKGDVAFALHYHAARRLLSRNPQNTLKWAMVRLGPRQQTARVVDRFQLADFFNLENHDPKVPF